MTTISITLRARSDEPRVWLGCLACYNDGRLVGEWVAAIDAPMITASQLHGRPTDHEELWCFDLDNLPLARELSPTEAGEWGTLLAEVDEHHRQAFAAWVLSGEYLAEGGGDLPSLADFEERYEGEWATFDDFGAELFEECGYDAEVPEHLAPYFDMRAWVRDLAYEYTTLRAPDGGVFVFRSL
ncbi:antirestriction protein ArdA [Pimelobacter simplex]|uniref:antirestriction protein ArdA n=1 Tax=Nocardioides simplex TaxID=2045 RepID=UPI00214F6539|nr:antirestriction protein ArdA [Pimelobacter simplex]UUW92249.1 antirestriction protein ArdA [Pimelobacter simplex]UUW96076.1 antirestriction protein ArdA [Pimelobacter simplex]